MIDPTQDGITHINIYSQGKTELGKLLSNFAHTPVLLKEGNFQSLEGYWYWLLSDKDAKSECLRKLYGYEAKKRGRELKIQDWPTGAAATIEFKKKFKEAMKNKIQQNCEVHNLLIESILPFYHYYVYDGRVHNVKGCQWMLDEWKKLRNDFFIDESEKAAKCL